MRWSRGEGARGRGCIVAREDEAITSLHRSRGGSRVTRTAASGRFADFGSGAIQKDELGYADAEHGVEKAVAEGGAQALLRLDESEEP